MNVCNSLHFFLLRSFAISAMSCFFSSPLLSFLCCSNAWNIMCRHQVYHCCFIEYLNKSFFANFSLSRSRERESRSLCYSLSLHQSRLSRHVWNKCMRKRINLINFVDFSIYFVFVCIICVISFVFVWCFVGFAGSLFFLYKNPLLRCFV